MKYDYDAARRLPVDPRIVRQVSKSPDMLAEQGASWMEGWGGPEGYAIMSELPTSSRLTYMAVLEGYVEPKEIEGITGLSATEVSLGLADLQKRRLVSGGEPVYEG